MSDTAEDIDLIGVFRVMPENVTKLWPQLDRLFAPALAMVSTHTIEDVRKSVMAMHSQLWVQIVSGEVVAAATTEFIHYPAGLFVRVWLAGAIPDRKMDDAAFFDVLDQWRRAHSCIGFEAVGRHGWMRRFPTARVEGLVMRLIAE